MNTRYEDCLVTLGDYSWIVLKAMGDKYFVLAENPLFKGYYSLEPCSFNDSKLHHFLDNKFVSQLVNGGMDASKLSGLGVLSLVQYERYVKDKTPCPITSFLLLTPHPDEPHCICGINPDGELLCLSVKDPCGIRPCMYVDKDYLKSVAGKEIHELEEIEIQKKEAEIIPPVVENKAQEEPFADTHTDILEEEENPTASDSVAPLLNPEEVERLLHVEATSELPEDGVILDEHPEEDKISEDKTSDEIEDISVAKPEEDKISDIEITTEATEADILIADTDEEAEISDIVDETEAGEPVDVVEIAEANEPDSLITEIETSDKDEEIAEDKISVLADTAPTEEGAVIRKETDTVSSVYVFDGQYKDFAVYLDESSETSKDRLESYGVAIRDYLANGDRSGRVPLNKKKAVDKIRTIQNRWRWGK